MTPILFFASWAIRSTVLISAGAVLLRVKSPSIRLAVWTVLLFGSLAIPAVNLLSQSGPVVVGHARIVPPKAPGTATIPGESILSGTRAAEPASKPSPWERAATGVYSVIAFVLLLRIFAGLVAGFRISRSSEETGESAAGIAVRESKRVSAPVTLGIIRPVIVLPPDWREWTRRELDAVLAHEASHVRRGDPAVQLISAFHRALLWHTPTSWLLHAAILRTAEELSDDAAITATGESAFYADVLLKFIRRGNHIRGFGIPMARYGDPEARIHRILDGEVGRRNLRRRDLAVVLGLGLPLFYVTAAAYPQIAPAPQLPRSIAPVVGTPQTVPKPSAHGSGRSANAPKHNDPAPDSIMGLGSVAAFQTVTVRPRIDGQLVSISVKEGEHVEPGQVLALIDDRALKLRVNEAEVELRRAEGALKTAQSFQTNRTDLSALEAGVEESRLKVEAAQLDLGYAAIVAPIGGDVGLRRIDPGNFVQASDSTGIMTIAQLQPIAVLFTIPEDEVPAVLAGEREHAGLKVELWNRSSSAKLADGKLVAIDNRIDPESGTAKLKAVFDNANRLLYPNQFVNVRLYLK